MKTYLAELKHGRFILLANDFICNLANLYGEWSEKEVELFSTILSSGDIVIEAGSHVGLHTIPLARQVGPQGSVIAIEPQRGLYHLLNGNIALNDLLNVYPFRAAVGENYGRAEVPDPDYETPNNYGNLSALAEDHGNVQMIPLDHLAAIVLQPVKLIKIDVEAAGVPALLGGKEIIARDRPFIFIEYFEQNDTIIETVRELGYRPFWFCAPGYSPNNWRNIRQNVFKTEDGKLTGDFNLLCVPVEEERFPELMEAGSGQEIEERKVQWVDSGWVGWSSGQDRSS